MIDQALGSSFSVPRSLFQGARADVLKKLEDFSGVLEKGIEDAKEADDLTNALYRNAQNAANFGIQLQYEGLRQEFLAYKGLGEVGAKGLASVARRSLSLAKATLTPLEYSAGRGKIGNGYFKSSFLV